MTPCLFCLCLQKQNFLYQHRWGWRRTTGDRGTTGQGLLRGTKCIQNLGPDQTHLRVLKGLTEVMQLDKVAEFSSGNDFLAVMVLLGMLGLTFTAGDKADNPHHNKQPMTKYQASCITQVRGFQRRNKCISLNARNKCILRSHIHCQKKKVLFVPSPLNLKDVLCAEYSHEACSWLLSN